MHVIIWSCDILLLFIIYIVLMDSIAAPPRNRLISFLWSMVWIGFNAFKYWNNAIAYRLVCAMIAQIKHRNEFKKLILSTRKMSWKCSELSIVAAAAAAAANTIAALRGGKTQYSRSTYSNFRFYFDVEADQVDWESAVWSRWFLHAKRLHNSHMCGKWVEPGFFSRCRE